MKIHTRSLSTLSLFILSFGFGISLPVARHANADGLKCEQLPQLFEAYFRGHYSYGNSAVDRKLQDEVRARSVSQLIKSMDPSKTMLLEEDVQKLKGQLPAVFSNLKKGDCKALETAYDLLITRAVEAEDFVRQFLGKDYKLDESVEVQLDPEKRAQPKTTIEKQDIIKKMVHFQMSNYLIAAMKQDQAKKQLIHRYELATRRLRERRGEHLINSLAESFAVSLDPHSSYLSQDNLEDFQINMQLSLEGIGASLSSEDGFTVIEDTIPGGGAERSGKLRPKDKIIAVAQQGQKPVSVIDMDLRDVVKLIRGKKGTQVTLTILRQAEATETFDIGIIRDRIDIKDQAAKISYETRKNGSKNFKIGVIDLPSFYGGEKGGRTCSGDVKNLLLQAKKEKVDGVVLNLARNGGGLLDEAVKISGLFIRKGGVVATKDTEKRVEVLADKDEEVAYAGPVVVLTSRLSASASEILAGALRDYGRAIVVGADHTFGKGTVQAVVGLPPGFGAMKITTGMFFVPGGKSTQHSGVPSDILVPSVFNIEEVGEKTLEYSLPPQAIDAFLAADVNSTDPTQRWQPVNTGLIKKLADRSQERVAKDAKFTEIRKEIEETAKNKGIVKLADLRKKSIQEKEKDKKAKKTETASAKKAREQKIKDTETPVVDESVNILVDYLTFTAQAV